NQIKSNLFYIALRTSPPVAVGRLLRFGVETLVAGEVLMLCVSIGAFNFWKVEEGRNDEALEIHDIHTGITGIQLSGGKKHYIKSQIKAFQRSRHSTRMKFDKKSLTWVATDRPLKNSSFLSTKILDLCGDLPIFWLQPTYHKGPSLMAPAIHMEGEQEEEEGEGEEGEEEEEEEEEEEGEEEEGEGEEEREEEEEEGGMRRREEEEGEEEESGAMTFDPMLDHQGIFCSECRHSYIHCCQVSYRDILPCRWWVACILGVVSVVHAHFLKPNSPTVLKVMFCKQQCHLYADIYCITLYLVVNTG
uniref:Leukocyte cell-derived chemotaxin 1 n=1 Tax=Oncorhynchus mykiss TaxID=8022 RepID=A0A8C7W194_ONCMY